MREVRQPFSNVMRRGEGGALNSPFLIPEMPINLAFPPSNECDNLQKLLWPARTNNLEKEPAFSLSCCQNHALGLSNLLAITAWIACNRDFNRDLQILTRQT